MHPIVGGRCCWVRMQRDESCKGFYELSKAAERRLATWTDVVVLHQGAA